MLEIWEMRSIPSLLSLPGSLWLGVVAPDRARVDRGAMTMKGYSAFPKAPALLEPHYQIV